MPPRRRSAPRGPRAGGGENGTGAAGETSISLVDVALRVPIRVGRRTLKHAPPPIVTTRPGRGTVAHPTVSTLRSGQRKADGQWPPGATGGVIARASAGGL